MSTKSVWGMSYDEIRVFALVLDKAGFDADLVQKIVNSKGNKSAKAMYDALSRGENAVFNPYLKCLSGDKPIIVPACDGSHTLAEAEKIFKSYIDPHFKNWGLDKSGEPTKATAIAVYQTMRDAKFVEMFNSIETDLDKLCFTQHQIEVFCKEYSNWLCPNGNATLFLFKVKDQFFVAGVKVDADGLYVGAGRFKRDYVGNTDYRHRLVVPQLET